MKFRRPTLSGAVEEADTTQMASWSWPGVSAFSVCLKYSYASRDQLRQHADSVTHFSTIECYCLQAPRSDTWVNATTHLAVKTGGSTPAFVDGFCRPPPPLGRHQLLLSCAHDGQDKHWTRARTHFSANHPTSLDLTVYPWKTDVIYLPKLLAESNRTIQMKARLKTIRPHTHP